MTVLISSDWHLTDNAIDADRWNIFPWLRTQAKKTGAKQLLMLGDITDAKDRHSSKLVNRLASEIAALAELMEVSFLRGNHDGLNEHSAFFAFMELFGHRVKFILEPTWYEIDDGLNGARTSKESLFLPMTKNYQEEWANLNILDKKLKFIFCHQTFDGALAENGVELRGIPPDVFKDFKGQVFSGDVHRPQRIGKNIEYVGCPYRVHFGDKFTPRVILLRKAEIIDLHFPGKSREVVVIRKIDDLDRQDFIAGTQLKVRIKLKRSEYPEWPQLRKEVSKLCDKRMWELCGIELTRLKSVDRARDDSDDEKIDGSRVTPQDIIRKYAEAKRLSKGMTQLGLDLLGDKP
jgi:DNA repair exonuclease SbcCD nuclease subunit